MSPPRIRIDRVEITNFKGIDHLVIDFPRPAFDHDPDITVMGSENGLGKTSVFEAIGLMSWIVASQHIAERYYHGFIQFPHNISKSITGRSIRSGEKRCAVVVKYNIDGNAEGGVIDLCAEGGVHYDCFVKIFEDGSIQEKGIVDLYNKRYSLWPDIDPRFGPSSPGLFGESPEPFIVFPIFYLNSYRKVREGGMSLQSLIGGTRQRDWYASGASKDGDASTSTAKNLMLRALMGQAGLFEEIPGESEADAINQLNELLGQFANVNLDKLKQGDGNTIDFRIRPLDGGGSYSFDGLSSGQKEIVATLFLIWRATKDNPCIVLIDEPELHLNAQWHKQVVRWLHKVAPWNQYILATHSADVFAAVPESQRILLRRGPDQ
jgi:predicted ATPase